MRIDGTSTGCGQRLARIQLTDNLRTHALAHSYPSILMVEDEALLLLTVADDLRDSGFRVLEASNAAQAVKLLESDASIDILFTDIDMPGAMNGLSLSALVAGRWPPVKIVITSGKRPSGDRVMPPNATFISKPYEFSALAARLRKIAN